MPRLLTLTLLSVLLSAAAAAQAPELRRVVLTDGGVLVGTVVDETADPVVVITRDGIEQRVPRARVAEITGLAGGRFERVDPTRTRTIVSPTGRTLGRGTGRVGTLVYVVPSASVGLTDRIDVSGTLGVAGGSGEIVALPIAGVKVGVVDTGSFAAAIGTTVALPLGAGESAIALTPYVAATYGDALRSVTLGATGFVGGTLGDGDLEAGDGVLLQLGGEAQVSNRVKVLGEVLVPAFAEGSDGVLVLPGVRFFGDQFSVDVYGVGAFGGGDVFGFAPLANFTYTF